MQSQDRPPHELVTSYYKGMSQFWQPVAIIKDLPHDKPVGTVVCGQDIVIAKLGNQFSAFDNLCPHFQVKLSLGEIDKSQRGEEILRCKYHGWGFNSVGKCVEIPQINDVCSIPKAAVVKKYQTKEQSGVLWVCLDENPKFTVPDLPEERQDGMRAIPVQINNGWCTSAVRMIMSALDDYHFPWLHKGVLGDREKPLAPERTYEVTATQLITRFKTEQPANVTNTTNASSATANVHYTMRVDTPNVMTLIKESPDGGKYAVWFAAKAETFDRTPVFWKVVRNYEADDNKVIQMENMIQGQDIPLVGSQRPWLRQPLPLRGIDTAFVKYMHMLRAHNIPTNI